MPGDRTLQLTNDLKELSAFQQLNESLGDHEEEVDCTIQTHAFLNIVTC
jgi:hypothetical protein